MSENVGTVWMIGCGIGRGVSVGEDGGMCKGFECVRCRTEVVRKEIIFINGIKGLEGWRRLQVV